ncbi:DUF3298 and DUF4163 domain-containing protein [Anaerosporobacter sp.]
MKKIKSFVLLTILMSLLLIGCRFNYHSNPNDRRNEMVDTSSNQAQREIPYEKLGDCLYIWKDKDNQELLQGHVKLSENVENENFYAEGTDIKILEKRASYPDVVGDLDSKINKAVEEYSKKRKDAFDSQVKEGLEAANNMAQGAPNNVTPYEFEHSWQVIRNDEKMLTIVSSVFSYAGGAHPNVVKDVSSFDPVEGEKLTIASITTDEKAFKQFVEEALNTYVVEHNCSEYLFGENGYKEAFKNWDRNWWIINGYLFVGFNTYDIAPYVAGPLVIPVDITNAKQYLSDYGKSLFE